MTQKQAAYFEKAYETRNIAVAAESMFVSRSVVSRAIQELEEEFGAPLFKRSRQGITPTEAGHMVHGLLLQFHVSYNTLIRRFGAMTRGSSARVLRLGVTPTNARIVAHLLFGPFRTLHPDVSVQITESSRESLLPLLAAGTVDMIVNPGSKDRFSGYDLMPLYQVQISLAVSETDPLARKKQVSALDLADKPLGFLAVPLSPIERAIDSACAALDHVPNVVIRTSDLPLLRELTERGQICAILPDDMIRGWNNVTAIPMEYPGSPSTHYLIWGRSGELCSAGRDFLRFIRECAPLDTERRRFS